MNESRDVQKQILDVHPSVFGCFQSHRRVKLDDELLQSLFLLPAVFPALFNIKQNFHLEILLIQVKFCLINKFPSKAFLFYL